MRLALLVLVALVLPQDPGGTKLKLRPVAMSPEEDAALAARAAEAPGLAQFEGGVAPVVAVGVVLGIFAVAIALIILLRRLPPF